MASDRAPRKLWTGQSSKGENRAPGKEAMDRNIERHARIAELEARDALDAVAYVAEDRECLRCCGYVGRTVLGFCETCWVLDPVSHARRVATWLAAQDTRIAELERERDDLAEDCAMMLRAEHVCAWRVGSTYVYLRDGTKVRIVRGADVRGSVRLEVVTQDVLRAQNGGGDGE